MSRPPLYQYPEYPEALDDAIEDLRGMLGEAIDHSTLDQYASVIKALQNFDHKVAAVRKQLRLFRRSMANARRKS